MGRSAAEFKVTAGVHADAGEDPESGLPYATLASIHEFGKGRDLPARPVVKSTFGRSPPDELEGALQDFARVLVLDGVAYQTTDRADAQATADAATEALRATIDAGVGDPLKPATVAAKSRAGFPDPSLQLVASGRLRSKYRGKVEEL